MRGPEFGGLAGKLGKCQDRKVLGGRGYIGGLEWLRCWSAVWRAALRYLGVKGMIGVRDTCVSMWASLGDLVVWCGFGWSGH